MASDEHPEPYQRPPNLTYAVDDRPPPGKLLLLGLQYAVLDAFYLVLVAIIVRHSNATPEEKIALMGISCVALAIGTVFQALRYGPIGSGYMAPPVFSATFMGPSVAAAEIGGMRLIYGMTVIAGLMEALIAICLHRLRVVITPIVSGMMVFIVGLQLGIVGIGEALDVQHEALPAFPVHLLVSVSTLAVCMALSIWGRGVLKLLCSFVGLLFGMMAAWSVGLIDQTQLAKVTASAVIALPHASFPDFGFDIKLLPAFLAAGAAAAFRTVGVVTTCQRINNAAWQHPDMVNIRKGVLADGMANVVGGLLGTTGMSIGPGAVGISSATGATSRVIAHAAAGYLLILGFSPLLAGSFLLIPPEIAGSIMLFTACFLIASGLQLMLSRALDSRGIYIIGIATLLALSENVFPDYFRHLPSIVHVLTASPLALGLTAALGLTLLFRLGTQQRDSLAWDDGNGLGNVMPFLRKAIDGWKVAPGIAERSLHDMDAIVAFLRESSLLSGRIRVMYNGIDLRTEVTYLGPHEAPLHRSLTPPAPSKLDEFPNEEAVAYEGIRDFLKSMAADRKRVARKRGQLSVRLSYETP